MAYRLEPFRSLGLDEALLALLLEEHASRTIPRHSRLWRYFRNPAEGRRTQRAAAGVLSQQQTTGTLRLAQECGLPSRLTGPRDIGADDRTPPPEIVIENDIAWRVQAMVDFMFGKPARILSTAPDDSRRRQIERVLDAVWEASGGIALLQDMALLGHIHGHVDLLVRVDEGFGAPPETARAQADSSPPDAPAATEAGEGPKANLDDLAIAAAQDLVRIELIDPARGLALLSPEDYRVINAYIIHFERELNDTSRRNWSPFNAQRTRKRSTFTEIISGTHRQRYDDGRLTSEEPIAWTGGRVPIVHIQNIAQPFRYEGLGEVEPLIPLQDELNTRLSDRASRVTLQSFKMYILKCTGASGTVRVGPGAQLITENPDARIETFGGDAQSPSEESHIQEIREALDKQSGVPPIASGVVRAKIGNLSSANALRITLMGVLSKTARKRVTYGRGIAEVSRLVLTALDHYGIFRTAPHERGVKLAWPDPLPTDVQDEAAAARIKDDLGIPRDQILAELGYTGADPGIQ